MEIVQTDIFGQSHDVTGEHTKKKQENSQQPHKAYRPMTIHDGNDEVYAANGSMLIHRMLQKKLSATGLKTSTQRAVFMRIFMNEARIKAGIMDPVAAVRDSLSSFFCML
jgi:hypothetical protein